MVPKIGTFNRYTEYNKSKGVIKMKTLLINAHPDFKNEAHFSNQLEAQFLKKYQTHFPMADLTILNLYEKDIPKIEDGQLWSIWDKQANKTALTATEAAIYQKSTALLDQFMAHKRIVIATPLHNFNITARMKDYLDNILIARKTFRYISEPLANGKVSQPLLTEDYRGLCLFASGSIYTRHDFYEHMDFAPKYLKAMFQDVMGFDQFDIVRAEGTATLKPAEIMAIVETALAQAFDKFYQNDNVALDPK